jgi:hypothetical protein
VLFRTILICIMTTVAYQSTRAAAPALSTTAACTRRFPYSAEEFVKKLLNVTADPDLFAMPRKFEDIFSVKLAGTRSTDGRTFAYKRQCGWYAAVDIATADIPRLGEAPETIEVSMRIEATPRGGVLRFHRGDICLRPDILDADLKKEGWSGVRSPLEPVMLYKKSDTKFISAFFGSHRFMQEVHGAPQSCVERLQLTFKNPN